MRGDAITPTTAMWRTRLPEFSNMPEPTLAAHLADAVAELDPQVWGGIYHVACIYLASARLAATPFGQQAKLADAKGESSYLTQYRQLEARVHIGWARVT